MPKTKISEYSVTNSSNTDIEGINIDEGCAPSGINNAIRELMVHLKEFQTGASGDAFTFAGGVLISGTANTITGNVLMSGTNTITGSTTATFAAGAVGTPSIAAHGDTNTGIFFPAADTIAFAEGGAEAMRIDSDGDVGIGTSSVTSGFRFESKGALPALFNNDSTANSPTYGGTVFYRPTNTTNNGVGLVFQLNSSTSASTEYAYIGGLIETNTQGSNNGAILFAPTSAGNRTERMRLNSNGNLVLSGGTTTANGVGITFPATQSASSDANTLDDYEEGTWTPAIAGGSGTTYANQNGWYTKVGNLVTIGFDLVINAKGTISGNAQITGLPFTSGSSPARAGGSLAVANNTGTAYVFTAVFIDNGVTTMDIYIKTAAAASTSIPTGTSFFAAGTQMIASLSYRV